MNGLKAKIDYPLLKKNLLVELTSRDEEEIERIMSDINAMKEQALPPEFSKEKICAKCAYYDLCCI